MVVAPIFFEIKDMPRDSKFGEFYDTISADIIIDGVQASEVFREECKKIAPFRVAVCGCVRLSNRLASNKILWYLLLGGFWAQRYGRNYG